MMVQSAILRLINENERLPERSVLLGSLFFML